ncbi:MAG: hypothetical protein B7Z61_06890, partial [Acidobacteria bacterium 37-71-11]
MARGRDAAVGVVERGRDAVLEQHEVVGSDLELLAPADAAGRAVQSLEADAGRPVRPALQERGRHQL